MKKNFYSLLLMAVALFSATVFSSCDKDDKNDKVEEPEPQAEKYVALQYWLSNDVLEIVDIETSGISNIAFTQSMQVKNNRINGSEMIDGKACRIIELTGDQVDNTEYAITLKMKPNWKEILGTKTQIYLFRASGKIERKGAAIIMGDAAGGKIDLSVIGEEKFITDVLALGFHRSAKKTENQ